VQIDEMLTGGRDCGFKCGELAIGTSIHTVGSESYVTKELVM
jgi:hypothetical protein